MYYRSDNPRRACVVNYIVDGVLSDTDEELLSGVPIISKVSYNSDGMLYIIIL